MTINNNPSTYILVYYTVTTSNKDSKLLFLNKEVNQFFLCSITVKHK